MDYTEYQVAISPELDITPEEFVRAWNANTETSNLATAYFTDAKAAKFLDPTIAGAMLSVPAGVASAALYDLIKLVIARVHKEKGQPQQAQEPLHVEETKKPGGGKILAVDKDG